MWNPAPFVSIEETPFHSRTRVLLGHDPRDSRGICLHGNRSWTGTSVLATVASGGACTTALHEESVDVSKLLDLFYHEQRRAQQILYRNEQHALAYVSDRAIANGIFKRKLLIVGYFVGRGNEAGHRGTPSVPVKGIRRATWSAVVWYRAGPRSTIRCDRRMSKPANIQASPL